MKVKVKEFYVIFDELSVIALIQGKKQPKQGAVEKIVNYLEEYWLGAKKVNLVHENGTYKLTIEMEKVIEGEYKDLPFSVDAVAQIEALERLFKVYL